MVSIGSTSVEGLAAKPIIDIQVSVRSWNNFEHLIRQFNSIGYVHRTDNSDKTKRYFREAPGGKRTHIHVRELGNWAEQFPLLFRDYLRCHTDECELYAAVKYELMKKYQKDRHGYVDAKEPIIWDIMRRASIIDPFLDSEHIASNVSKIHHRITATRIRIRKN
ncbi:GrpB family protein [Paenibacillus popilliae]|nr:GrpB family protein [Paenibacillus sp. SDF0028]